MRSKRDVLERYYTIEDEQTMNRVVKEADEYIDALIDEHYRLSAVSFSSYPINLSSFFGSHDLGSFSFFPAKRSELCERVTAAMVMRLEAQGWTVERRETVGKVSGFWLLIS